MKNSIQEWAVQDESKLFQLHLRYGNRWSIIANHLNKPDNCVKNKFYSTLRKGFRKVNRYIANIRRSNFRSQLSANKLLKTQFLTKLIAITDRNFEQKYEVRQKAIDLSQAIMQKLIELAQNDADYQKNDQNSYTFEEELLSMIQEFSRNCKRRKGKRKSKPQSKRTSSYESKSLQQSVSISVESEPSNPLRDSPNRKSSTHNRNSSPHNRNSSAHNRNSSTHNCNSSTQKQSQKEASSKLQTANHQQDKKEDKQQQQPHLLLVQEPRNTHCSYDPYDELNANDYIINDLPFADNLHSNYNDTVKTPSYSVASMARSLVHITDPSPCNVPASFKQTFQAALKGINQASLHISKNTESSVLERSHNMKERSMRSIDFIERIPMMSQSSEHSIFFNSVELGKVSKPEPDDHVSMEKTLSNSETYDSRKTISHFKQAEVPILPHRLEETKYRKKISTIQQIEYQSERQFENSQSSNQ